MESADLSQPEAVKFESALKQLEELVATMESGDLPLDELVAKYEEGRKLIAVCGERLNAAELRIRELTENQGRPQERPFEETRA